MPRRRPTRRPVASLLALSLAATASGQPRATGEPSLPIVLAPDAVWDGVADAP